MMRMTLAELVEAVGGQLIAADDGADRRMLEGLTWDSRQVKPDMVFLAMPGERVDGNDFVTTAAGCGAGAVIMTRQPSEACKAVAGEFACPLVVVEDGVKALSDLAAYWRTRLHAIVVGVTGSSGKTSTKDLLKSVLSERFKTVATSANHNNEIGVPATVLSASEDTEVLIVEMGMRGLKQIEPLCEIVRPSIGVITNIGVSHMELLGSQDNIALAKSELLSGLSASGVAVVNADDPFTPKVLEFARVTARHVKTVTYGMAEEADVRADDIHFDEGACARFALVLSGRPASTVYLNMPGRHNVSNALAATAVGQYLGMTPEQIVRGLEKAQASGMRMEVKTSAGGVQVVNDAYNANPDSMRSALDTLATMNCAGRRIAVLGDMGELGSDEASLHAQVGAHAAVSNLDLLVCIGELAKHIASGARAAGMEDTAIIEYDTVQQATDALQGVLASGDLVLVKASRFMGLERLVKEIV